MMNLTIHGRDNVGLNLVADELKKVRSLYRPCHSSHEAYAVILEEIEEFWEEVKKKKEERNTIAMRNGLVQVATTAIRAITDLELTPEY